MNMRWGLLWVVVISFSLSPSALGADGDQPVRFDNHHLVWVQLETPADVDTMLAISRDHWSDGIGVGRFRFRVPPEEMENLRTSGLSFGVQHENIQELIDRQLTPAPRGGWFEEYKTADEIYQRLDELVALEPDLVTKFQIGSSIEGRPIYAITIASDVGGPDKPAVCYNGTQHAREWITPMTVMYIANKLVTEYGTNPVIGDLVDRVTFHIVPIVNPDGYQYSWDVNRMWRKNRRDNGGGIYGVDLNRNWAYEWGGEGSSGDPDSTTYRGPAPFSEPETQALRDFIITQDRTVVHVDYHSYGQLILWPFGYTRGATPPEPDNSILANLGRGIGEAIYSVHAVGYTPQPSWALYPASGISIDWVYGDQGIWSYCIEVRDTGQYGFLLPPDQIIPTAEENFEAVFTMVDLATTPLQIVLPEGLPAYVAPNTAVTVAVHIYEIGDTLAPGTAKLVYRYDGGAFVESALWPLSSYEFEATLPAVACGDGLEYYFVAESQGGAVITSPENAPESLYETPVQLWDVMLEHDMESEQGWISGALGDTASTGIWNRMDPEATAAQPEDDHTPAPGVACWVTDGRAGNSIGQYDVDDGHTTLLSPIFDAGQGDALISYWRWYSNDEGSGPGSDVFTIDISNDAGNNWENVEVVGPTGPEASGGWFSHEFVVDDVLTPTGNMQMRFIAADEGAGSIVEAAIDDFRVAVELGCPVVPGDLNCDGTVDAFDIDPFVLALTDPTQYATTYSDCVITNADCNEDGVINAFDIDPFVELLTGP